MDVRDCKAAQACIEAIRRLVADKPVSSEVEREDDGQALREWLAARGTQSVVPPRRNRKIRYNYDKAIYRQRNVVERLFAVSTIGDVLPPVTDRHAQTISPPLLLLPPSQSGPDESPT